MTTADTPLQVWRATLARSLLEHEQWLIHRSLDLARAHGYTRYTPTVIEAWRIAVRELSGPLVELLESPQGVPSITADDDPEIAGVTAFARREAAQHRERGIGIGLFLGLLKHLRAAFIGLVGRCGLDEADQNAARHAILTYFDQIEIALANEWTGLTEQARVDELRARNAELTREKNRFLTIFENLGSPALFLRPDGTIENANRAAAELLPEVAAIGNRYYPNVETDHRCLSFDNEIVRFIAQEADLSSGERHVDTLHGPRFLRFTLQRTLDINERFGGVILLLSDLSERKRAEEEKLLMEIQLRQAQKLEAIGQLASGIAHELNTPIQYIGDNLRFLEQNLAPLSRLLERAAGRTDSKATGSGSDDDLDFVLQETPLAIRQSLDGVERVTRIVGAMREFAHPGTEASPLDLAPAIESTVTVARNEYKHVAELIVELPPALPRPVCDQGAIKQVLLNLLVNAAQAVRERIGDSGTRGTIAIAARAEGDGVEIRVADSGTGIPDTIAARVFEPFFTTKPVGQGTGQGLAICHDVIVRRHKGQLDFTPRPGGGTVFRIWLPLAAGGPSAQKRAEAAAG